MNNRTVFSGVPINWLAVVAGVFCLSLAVSVSAEDKGQPCMADAEKLCQGVEKGEGRMMKCLKEHDSEVSAACKNNMGKMKKHMRENAGEMKEACGSDKDKLCKGVKPGQGNILECLKEHEAELSASCKDKISKSKDRKDKHGSKE